MRKLQRIALLAANATLVTAMTSVMAGCNGNGLGAVVVPPTNPTPVPPPSPLPSPAPPPNPTPDKPVPNTPVLGAIGTIELQTYADPWLKAEPRLRDIANNSFTALAQGKQTFTYSSAQVTLTYRRAPGVPYFTGHLKARGLKPNFAYQMKLAGKPIFGNRGTGTSASYVTASTLTSSARPVPHLAQNSAGQTLPINGDDWSNQQLGYAGRWWDDTLPPSTNLDDAYFRFNYPRHTIYGYIFFGVFVTDYLGNAELDIAASHSYHITWQDEQNSYREADAGTYLVKSAPPFPGYGQAIAPQNVKLWYEFQSGRANNVRLAPGTYHCRLLLTEEAFHGEGGEGGGVWQTVLATETRDTIAANDIVFVIE